mgnify:CR=1 FL=1
MDISGIMGFALMICMTLLVYKIKVSLGIFIYDIAGDSRIFIRVFNGRNEFVYFKKELKM